jgi:hypothetical protein
MTIEIMTLSEMEQEVIEAAIEFVNQTKHGRYRDVPNFYAVLVEAVEKLVIEHDGRWQPQENKS